MHTPIDRSVPSSERGASALMVGAPPGYKGINGPPGPRNPHLKECLPRARNSTQHTLAKHITPPRRRRRRATAVTPRRRDAAPPPPRHRRRAATDAAPPPPRHHCRATTAASHGRHRRRDSNPAPPRRGTPEDLAPIQSPQCRRTSGTRALSCSVTSATHVERRRGSHRIFHKSQITNHSLGLVREYIPRETWVNGPAVRLGTR